MPRLVLVSNRVPASPNRQPAGGLATALSAALKELGGMWFGWSGDTTDIPSGTARLHHCDNQTLATIDLSPTEHELYYNCFSNRALWPIFHGRADLATVHAEAYATYRSVNRKFADSLLPHLQHDDLIWVHDYHLIPLGAELRRRGVRSAIGFFLHIPFPAPETFAALPWAHDLARALMDYDLVGFQTRTCQRNFREFVNQKFAGFSGRPGQLPAGGFPRTEVHPVGIDADYFATLAASEPVAEHASYLRNCLNGQSGIVGVERLDYSKGIAERFRAFEILLRDSPDLAGQVTLLQIAAPSRLGVPEYQQLKADLEALSGRINAELSHFGWTPICYLNRAFSHQQVAAMFRACRVGLVTPLRDGMNLVAKEYVAAQDPTDPGVLILSAFAGSAAQLEEALIVNPYDAESMASALRKALVMPLAERQACTLWVPIRLRKACHLAWRRNFLRSLRESAHPAPGLKLHSLKTATGPDSARPLPAPRWPARAGRPEIRPPQSFVPPEHLLQLDRGRASQTANRNRED